MLTIFIKRIFKLTNLNILNNVRTYARSLFKIHREKFFCCFFKKTQNNEHLKNGCQRFNCLNIEQSPLKIGLLNYCRVSDQS